MTEPKTVKGYIKTLTTIEATPLSYLKGWDKLTEEQQFAISELSGAIGNRLSDIDISDKTL